jgi:hypothetical protein
MPTQFPNCPYTISVGDLTVRGTLDVRGDATFNQIFFDNSLITKIYMYSTTYGMGISSSQMNFFCPSSASFRFYSGGDNNSGTEVFRINASGITVPGDVTVAGQTMYPIVVPPTIPTIAAISPYYLYVPADAKRITLCYHNIGTTVGTFPPRFTFSSLLPGPVYNDFNCDTANTQGLSTVNTNSAYLNIWSGTTWGTAHRMSGCVVLQYMGKPDANNIYYAVSGGGARTDAAADQAFTYAGTITNNAIPITALTRIGIFVGSGAFVTGSYATIIYE